MEWVLRKSHDDDGDGETDDGLGWTPLVSSIASTEGQPWSRKTILFRMFTLTVYVECQSQRRHQTEFLIACGMLYFIEVLLEALFLTVDPYMRYDFPPKKLHFVLWTLFWNSPSFNISNWLSFPQLSQYYIRDKIHGCSSLPAKVWEVWWEIPLAPLFDHHFLS